ncbi:MAG: acyl transferase [Bacteroidia bacterium]
MNFLKPYTHEQFKAEAIEIFYRQYSGNKVYRAFVDGMKVNVAEVRELEQIPFLPVELFKTNKVTTGDFSAEAVFTSSGTTGEQTAQHYVKSLELYEADFTESFRTFYGLPHGWTFLALLPSYLEREGSSLIYMMEKLIEMSDDNRSGFFLHNHHDLFNLLMTLRAEKKKTLLLGVTYALLDFAENFQIEFPELVVMETGGMKGKRREMIREEVHDLLKNSFSAKAIHSEYGMTELMSQAYSDGNGLFKTPPWMKILIRDVYNPMDILSFGRNGGINIIDFGNVDSCSFIATQDTGRLHADGSFEVTGRIDFSDIRGCNLMVS